jgi:hypothetical protein
LLNLFELCRHDSFGLLIANTVTIEDHLAWVDAVGFLKGLD